MVPALAGGFLCFSFRTTLAPWPACATSRRGPRTHMFSKDDCKNAPAQHLRFEGTAVEVTAHRTGENNLHIVVNINGSAAYRATLQDCFRIALDRVVNRRGVKR
jgi:hypothetical protein